MLADAPDCELLEHLGILSEFKELESLASDVLQQVTCNEL